MYLVTIHHCLLVLPVMIKSLVILVFSWGLLTVTEMLILSELYSTGPYRMRVHYLCPVLLQRRSQTFLLPHPLQTDWHSVTPQILLQHIQLTTFLKIGEKTDRTNRGIQMNRKERKTEKKKKI